MDLSRLRDRKVMVAAGAGALALVAGLGIGIGMWVRVAHKAAESDLAAESAGPNSLQVEMGSGEPGMDLTRPLRCFVGGQFVGMLTLRDCAKRNGVDPAQLDVGLDTTGDVAAASSAADVLQPLPSAPTPPAALSQSAPGASPSATPEAAAPAAADVCWSYAGDWRKLGDNMTLDACVQALYAGRCVHPGAADYGRWGDDTLRLVTGKVERQTAGGGFRTLVRQPPGDCAIPHLEG